MLKLSTLTLALTAAYVFLPGMVGLTQTPVPVNNSRPETANYRIDRDNSLVQVAGNDSSGVRSYVWI